MPLVRRDPKQPAEGPAPGAPALGDVLPDLDAPDPERRRRAVRACARHPDAIGVLAERLNSETDPGVCEAIFSALLELRGPEAARVLLPLLGSEDASLRNGAVEVLQAMPEFAGPHIAELLANPDSDVRILATELARRLPPAKASEVLCRALGGETHVNVCAAAIDVLAEVGTEQCLPTLREVAARFPGEPFLPFAASVAIARIEGSEG